MESNTVSVIMCTYNGEKYLREQIDSILAQTYPIHEIIVCDDCSTDNTMAILQEYATRFTFIKVHQNEKNKGCNQNFHDTLYKATGNYIAISDQDDIWFPEKIEKQLHQIKGKQEYILCFSDIIASTTFSREQTKDYENLPYTVEALLFRNTIPGHTILVKRTFIESLPDWNNMTFYYDWWLAMNAALVNGITKCNVPLVWHRIHSESEIAHTSRKLSQERNHSPIAPYILGIKSFFNIRKNKSWQCFYGNIQRQTSQTNHPILHLITRLFYCKTLYGIIKLCLTCMRYREQTYPHPHKEKGMIFALRGFFAPFLCFYYNLQFMKKDRQMLPPCH